jgi:hypothetical protein
MAECCTGTFAINLSTAQLSNLSTSTLDMPMCAAELFMCATLQRPEGVIAVVAHSGFLRCSSRQYGLDAAGIVKDELHRWCEHGPSTRCMR